MEETLNATLDRNADGGWDVVMEVDRDGDVEPVILATAPERGLAVTQAVDVLRQVMDGGIPMVIGDLNDEGEFQTVDEPPYDNPIVAFLPNGTVLACGWALGNVGNATWNEAKRYVGTWLEAVQKLS